MMKSSSCLLLTLFLLAKWHRMQSPDAFMVLQCIPSPSDTDRPGPWQQCGGMGFSDNSFCTSGLQCIWIDPFYSQCTPDVLLADLDEPCGPATSDNKKCALQSLASGPVYLKCSSSSSSDAKCVLCGFRGLACCPAGFTTSDRPPCQAAPRVTPEIPCNAEDDICEGDSIPFEN